MKEIVNERLVLGTTFTRQYDALVQEEIGARYGYEMAVAFANEEQTAKNRTILLQAEAVRLTFEKVIEAVTGLEVAALRLAVDELATILSRRAEVETEYLKLKLLSPALEKALDAQPRDETTVIEAKEELQKRKAELPQIEAHLNELVTLAETIAVLIDYPPIAPQSSLFTL